MPSDRNDLNQWEEEFNRTALKYHLIVCKVAIVLNPVFGISDYFTLPAHFTDFMTIRLAVSVLTLFGLLFYKKLHISSSFLAFIPVVGIAWQNAYMYSVMDVHALQKHTFAFIALFIGAGMLVLWKPVYTVFVVASTSIARLFLFYFNSLLILSDILINGGLLVFAVSVFAIVLIQTRYNLTKKEIISRFALQESNRQLEITNAIIEEKNKSITDSINYAQKIQSAILPDERSFIEFLPDSFILYKPKDILSGDFYWLNQKEDCVLFAAADCTGHGVPGALMSMLGCTFLNEIVNEKQVLNPADVLFELRERIIAILKQNQDKAERKDGMDIALCKIDLQGKRLFYSGAFNPLWVVRKGALIEFKANKFPIGTFVGEKLRFTAHDYQLEEGDCIYLFTDGYADQFGGPSNKKFNYKRMSQLLLDVNGLSMQQQKTKLEQAMEAWQKQLEQVDDMLVMGIRI
jgi:sigma-B regulation protein RsbU (phosphoserine phosphatase)